MQSVFRSSTLLAPSSLSWSSRCLVDGWKIRAESLLPVTAGPLVIRRTKKTVVQTSSENLCKATSAIFQSAKGRIYDKKPFKFRCEEGKSYLWCTCGWSKTQPFCDSTHKNPHMRITMRPVRFIPRETKEYIFCNCKQTNNRPFCDGTHKREDIQAAIRS